MRQIANFLACCRFDTHCGLPDTKHVENWTNFEAWAADHRRFPLRMPRYWACAIRMQKQKVAGQVLQCGKRVACVDL
jgi:hypothetical protein